MRNFNLSENELKRYRNDHIYNYFIHLAQREGWSKEKTDQMLIEFLLDLKDELYQKRLDEMASNPSPMVHWFSNHSNIK